MLDCIKGLLGKVFKEEEVLLSVGSHYIDETVVVRVRGSVEKAEDQMVLPTVSIPMITTLALFWEKAGIEKERAITLLREAITEAMDDGVNEDARIKARIDDVNAAITAVRKELIEKLPKMPRTGRVLTKDLTVTVLPHIEDVLKVS